MFGNSAPISNRINKEQQEKKQMSSTPNENSGVRIEGHIKIWDPTTGEVIVNKRNAIHYENFSESLALSVGNQQQGWIHEMAFGNGGTSVDPTGVINYLPSNTNTQNADLYNPTFAKIVDDTATANPDKVHNKIEVRHVPGQIFSDLLITCLLDYGEPVSQAAFDNSQNLNESYVFDELGLKSYSSTGNQLLLTHVIFHPVQKSLNRLIQIDYTVRIQSLTGLVGV